MHFRIRVLIIPFSSLLIPDIYDDYATPVPAAQGLFHSSCKKRKGILQEAMLFLKTVNINNQCIEANAKNILKR